MRLRATMRNGMLNALETVGGTSPRLQLRSGSTLPATEDAAATGNLLAEGTLPSDWAAAASGGTKVLAGTWTLTGVADGTAAHYEWFASDGTTRLGCGSVSGPGGGGELVINSTGGVIAVDQEITVTAWTLTAGNAFPS